MSGWRLHHSPTSPFVRKVMVTLHETGLIDRVELAAAAGTAVAPGTMPVHHNPLGKIPTLERPEGPALYDSRVICRYLDALAKSGLYPAEPRLWETLTLEATADGICEAAVLMVYETRVRPEESRFPDWVEGQWQKVARALDALEARWMPHLHGPREIGQIAVGCALGCALGYLDFRHAARNWRAGRPALAGWFGKWNERPAMQATMPVG